MTAGSSDSRPIWPVVAGAVFGAGLTILAGRLFPLPHTASGSPSSTQNLTPQKTSPELSAHLEALDSRLLGITSRLDELATRQRELEKAQQSIAESMATLQSGHQAPGATADITAAPDPDEEVANSEQAYQTYVQRAVETLGAQLAAEATDPAWSVAASDQIRDASRQPQFAGSTLNHIECRSTLCVLQTFHENRAALNAYSLQLPEALDWNCAATMQVQDNPDGTLTSLIYISRDGFDLEY